MKLKKLGSTGVELPEIGMGTWQYKGSLEPLRRGMELGAFLIDTAEAYGTEGTVGEAVRGQRARVFVATKVSPGHLRYKDVLQAAENSLHRLGIDYIDLYQVHWPSSSVPIEETMRAMEELVDMGKVRFIGVSNFSAREVEEAQRALTKNRIVSNQVVYSLSNRGIERELLPFCQRNDITVLAYSPLARGALTSKPLLLNKNAMAILARIAGETGKTMAQVALNWCISKSHVIAIPKSNSARRVEENCGASGWTLTDRQIDELERAFN